MHSISYTEYLAPCCDLAQEAGRLIMGYYQQAHGARKKADHSPVTDADVAANALIVKALREIAPDIAVVAEEDEQQATGGYGRFWLVDPLDGTRSFVRGEPEFTVNIALVVGDAPVFGVIYAPVTRVLYLGGVGLGAFRAGPDEKPQAIRARREPADGVVLVRSRSTPSKAAADYLASQKIVKMIPSSSSIKFCQVAEGSADRYPRFGRTMEWDTAAGQAILEAAGGRVQTLDGKPFLYGKPGYENPGFIAYGLL